MEGRKWFCPPGQLIRLCLKMVWLFAISVADPDPNPDPHVFGPPGSGSFYHKAKNSKKNLDSYCFVTSFWLFISENDENVPFKKYVPNKQNNFFLNLFWVGILKVNDENRRIRIRIRIRIWRQGSADPDPDPDPHQNVMDSQNWFAYFSAWPRPPRGGPPPPGPWPSTPPPSSPTSPLLPPSSIRISLI